MSKDLIVGDVCLTVNTLHPACNDGMLVVVIGINQTIKSARGESIPYLIRRVDGSPFTSTFDLHTRKQYWCKSTAAWCAGYKLQRIDDHAKDSRDRIVKREKVSRKVIA